MPEKPKSKIEELSKRLYSTNFKDRPIIEKLEAGEHEVSDTWKQDPPVVEGSKTPRSSQSPLLKKILILSFSFFIIAVGVAIFYLYKGSGTLSANNVDISIEGPVSVAGGDDLKLGISVTNNNDAAVDDADLLIEYPEGSYASADSQSALPRIRKSLGRIEAHQTIRENVQAVIFGESNSEKKISATLEFRLEGSSATLEKKKEYAITLSSSPIDIVIDSLKEANSGQTVEVDVHLKSNSSSPLKDLLLSVDYPFGFQFKESTPKPNFDNKIWKLGDLPPAGERVIRIKGIIQGQDEEEKIFRAYVGTQSNRDERALGIAYNSLSSSIFLKKPFLSLDFLIDGVRANEYVSSSEKTVRVDISWENNLPTKIIDGQIQIKIKGNILDRYSIAVANGGFYRSLDDTIVWDSKSGAASTLAVIEPGEKGNVSFSFGFLPVLNSDGKQAFANPEVTMEVTAKGRRVTDTNVPEEVNTFTAKKIKVESSLNLASRAVYYTGPLKNTGPLPPKVNQPTTYTIIWTLTNSSNNISSGVVRTLLPTYVKWLGVVSPDSESVTYNDVGGEVTWNVGAIPAGVGVARAAREVAFQVALTPSISQLTRSPSLTSEVTLTGNDDFTGTTLHTTKQALSTNLTTDPTFIYFQALVTE